MTVATLLPDSSVESVKHAVRSTTTCSNATVLSLQTLFRSSSKSPTDTDTPTARQVARTTKESSTATSRTRVSRATKTKTSTPDAVLSAVVEKDSSRLTYQERLVLATEVFNTTLKTLSDAVKLQSSKRDDARSRSGNSTPRSTSPTKSKSSRGQEETSLLNVGVVAVAECARLALSSLRTLKSEQSGSDPASPNIQLEQGACVLAGRYLSLGLNDMAYKELRGLKRRMQQYLDSRATARKKSAASRTKVEDDNDEAAKERMSDLLTFAHIAQAEPILGLLVSFHSNALRLIVSERKLPTIQKLAPSLQLADSSSPASVILAALESGVLTTDKAAIQLQTLSNTILSLSGSQQSSSPSSKDRLKPITSFTLQVLSLEIRCMSWKMSGHVCDERKEMLDPLARYLASFAHHTRAIEKSEFAAIYNTTVRLQSAFTKVAKAATATTDSTKDSLSLARIATLLGQLGQEAGCFEEALQLFTQSLTPLSTVQCLNLATVRCKIASLHIQATKTSKKFLVTGVLEGVSEATAALGMQLRGSSSDLDELLVEAAKLKKLAMAWFGDIVKGPKKSSDLDDAPSRIHEYLAAFVRFLRRYIGRQPSQEDDTTEYASHAKRVDSCRSIVLAAVDSAIVLGKLSVISKRPCWEDILSCLTDCPKLLAAISTSEEETVDAYSEQVDMGFVKLSNLFWSRYLKEKEIGQGWRELIPVLKHSANLLSNCSPAERSTGFAALKYERLAHVYMEANFPAESGKAFFQSISEHIDGGVLDQIMSDMSGEFPHRASQDPQSPGFMLGRVLSTYLKMKLRTNCSKLGNFFDLKTLPLLERGHLLEWQLGILIDLHLYAHNEDVFRVVFGSLLSKLLGLYSFDVHPIRRSRVILTGLRFSLERPNCLDSSLQDDLTDEAVSAIESEGDCGDDSDVLMCSAHLKNSIRLTLGLHQGNLQPDQLNAVVSSWNSMILNCRDYKTLVAQVGDVDYCLLQMKAVVDYTEIHGLWRLQLSTLEMILRVNDLQASADFSEAIIILARLVLQYCRLGYCNKAHTLLSKADQYLKKNDVSCLAKLSHQLAWVGYLLETGDIDQAAKVLSTAQALYEKNQKSVDMNTHSVMTKIAWERLVADASFMSSRLSFAQGSINNALYFAKLCVRLNCRIWAKVEKIAQRNKEKALPANDNSELETVVEGIAKLDVSQTNAIATPSTYTQGAPFWPHIGSHHTSLLNLASLSAHHGLFQDAIYYGEQALKINRTLNANVRLVASQVQLGSHWIFGGHISEGQELLAAAETMSQQLDNSVELVSLQLGLASLYRTQGQYKEELQALVKAEKHMTEFVRSEMSVSPNVVDLEEKMDQLSVRPRSRRTRQQTTAATSSTTTRRTRAATTSSKSAPQVTKQSATVSIDSASILQLRSAILQQQAACSRALNKFDKASSLLESARPYALSRDSKISLHIEESENYLADAIRHFASHAVYCVLPESTISLPSLQTPTKASGELKQSTKTSTVRRSRAPVKAVRSRTQKANEDFTVMLSKAGDSLHTVFPTAAALGSTLDSHAASRLMSRISMLTQVTAAESSALGIQSPANINEIGRIGAFAREHVAIDIDKELADSCDPLTWPVSKTSTRDPGPDMCTNFTKQYVDILPDNWNVLSLSLSADRDEFVISRLQRGHSPFLLRLPLKRGGSDDDEEEQFTFEDGRVEMQELIKLANESAHAAKAQIDRQSKKNWWKNREALDRRMENLLQNIENVWFGGFRGIFSPVPHDALPLTKFANAFHSMLDKHLPSRQKGKKAAGPRLTLHDNVLELFIGVKDLGDQEDPEDTLMDLLYFVVDILQFQGERNAYDEIDFDMMVVDTLDALRGYHESIQHGQQGPNHTVLVLDKALHLFPWESLPCLQGFPVCRVPSLECLRDRVLQFRQDGASKMYLDRNKGTYILNPTGDLQTTQGTFEKDLTRLHGWNGIVKRVPTEDEFKDGLESSSLFLYFGHGSGAQYIRGRTVRRLDRCAVAFLMGCSSGTLTEAGEYEPYGTPMNYLQAGSPAVVATLWDVTDKDIDRFAKSTFEKWGLVGETDEKGPTSMDAAVSQSRGACVLKYLNGAAPVIYGIPGVFLE